MNSDLISRSELKEVLRKRQWYIDDIEEVEKIIDNAPTVEEIEKPFITECRNEAIEKNLPLYFVYYEETGISF